MADQNKVIDPYTNIPYVEEDKGVPHDDLSRVRSFQAGFGSKVLRIDKEGLWLGAERFADAPFSVDMEGNITATSLTASFVPVGGAATDINNNATTISGGKITTGSIAANKLSVSTLSAITADLGTVTAGSITGVTITGATIRTSSSGGRVEILGSSDSIRIYDSSNELRLEIVEDIIQFNDENGTAAGTIFATDTGTRTYMYFDISGQTDGSFLFDIDNTGIWGVAEDGNLRLWYDTSLNSWIFHDDLQPDGVSLIDIGTSTNPFDDIYCDLLTETSDIRLKTDVKPSRYGLKELLKLEPIEYRFKKDRSEHGAETKAGIQKVSERRMREKMQGMSAAEKRAFLGKKTGRQDERDARQAERLAERSDRVHIGFSAQAVYEVMPEVTLNAEPNSKGTASIRKTQLIPVLVQAVKELYEEKEALAERVEKLERGGKGVLN